jgi:MFS family permease
VFKLSTINCLRLNHLFLGMMFFFGIEQLFLNTIIGGASSRGYVVIVYVASVLVFDIPTGMLADKYGRKKKLTAS